MGTGKKLAQIKRDMAELKNDAVTELMMAQNREGACIREIHRLRDRLAVRTVLAVLALVCWLVTALMGR